MRWRLVSSTPSWTAATSRIFTLRRDLIRFQRVLLAIEGLTHKLACTDSPIVDERARAYFADVLDHVRRVETMVAGLRDVLASVFEFGNLLEQQHPGVTARQLAAWAAILAVPTAIASIYGMNFIYLPELKWRYGYFVVLGVMSEFCLALYRRFRTLDWL